MRASIGKFSALAGVLILLVAGCRRGVGPTLADPIPHVPATQQRAVDRHDFEADWPFTVGAGIVGCVDGAVLFRAGGVTYALNEAARRRPEAPAAIGAIQRSQGSGPPSHPLSRLKQDVRMQVFAAAMRCERNPAGSVDRCRQAVRAAAQLSDDELGQIEAEGRERSWPPLALTPASVDPVVRVGHDLCRAAASR